MPVSASAAPKKRTSLVFGYALFIAAAVLFFCTKSSPAYPINDWCDANIYFTIGKGMTRGQVVYRDLYDHKGPLLYALHALCALVSFRSFFGVYLMEVLAGAGFLFFSFKLFSLYDLRRASWLLLPVLALIVYSAYSFSEGDSAEELCMPLIAASLWHVLAFLRCGEGRMSARGLVLEGFLAGCVFWIKFTVIGIHAGLLLCLLLQCAIRREWRGAMKTLGWLIAGFALSTLPWVIYFGINGAILPWLKTYLYDNLFLYGSDQLSAVERVKAIASYGYSWIISNLRYTLPIFLGLGWIISKKSGCAWERRAVWLAAVFGALAVFIGCKNYSYYGQALAPLAALGLIPVGRLGEKALKRLPRTRGLTPALCALACAVCVGLCPLIARNMTIDEGVSFGQARQESMQYQFAAYINEVEGATLLNYGFMDAGFYTAAGIVPNVKYFQENNVPLQEMRDEQNRYLEEALCDFVVTRGNEPESIHDHYDLVAAADSPGFWYKQVFLYRRRERAD